MSLQPTVGGFRAPRKKTVPIIRDYDDKKLHIYEDPSPDDEPQEPFMAKNINEFLVQAAMGVQIEVQNEDGTTTEIEYNVLAMEDLGPDMVRRNCAVIKEQHIKRLALQNLRSKLLGKHNGQNPWTLSPEERTALAKELRHFAKHYRQLGA